jgi:hypothetical protein
MKSMGILGIISIALIAGWDILMGSGGFTRYLFAVGGNPLNSGTVVMAKKKAPAAKSEPAEERVVIIHLKGSPAYAEWLDQVHKTTHIAKATLFRLAMSEWARKNGHPAPPEM